MLITVGVILIALILLQGLYTAYFFRIASRLSKTTFARKTTLGDSRLPEFKLFIAGDSVGAGVGASSFEESVAGRLGNYFATGHYVSFENVSVSGHKVADVLNSPAPTERQDLVVLIVSSNNLFRLTNLKDFAEIVPKLFRKYTPIADKVLLIGPGRVGDSQAIPLLLRPIYRFWGKKYSDVLKEEARKYPNIAYVNPLEHSADLKKYGYTLAEDKFHPNNKGHEFWFDLIISGLKKQSPGG